MARGRYYRPTVMGTRAGRTGPGVKLPVPAGRALAAAGYSRPAGS